MPDAFALARMVEALALKPEHRVLEVGTGSGYATAVIAKLVRQVLSIERFQSLVTAARTRIAALQVANVEIVWGDGTRLPPEIGSFDRIFVEASVLELSPAWVLSLACDGIIVIAKRTAEASRRQHVVRLSRDLHGNLVETKVMPTRLQALLDGQSCTL